MYGGSPRMTFSRRMRTWLSLSERVCSWLKPRACNSSCWTIWWKTHPLRLSDTTWPPPIRPTKDQHLDWYNMTTSHHKQLSASWPDEVGEHCIGFMVRGCYPERDWMSTKSLSLWRSLKRRQVEPWNDSRPLTMMLLSLWAWKKYDRKHYCCNCNN